MGTFSIFSQATFTTGTVTRADGAYSVGTEFTVSQPVWATGQLFYRFNTTITGTPTGALFQVTASDGSTGTQLSAIVSFTLSTTAGWKSASYTTPILLLPGNAYRVVTHNNPFTENNGYWTTGAGASGITSGPLTAPSQSAARGAAQCSWGAPGTTLVYPNNASGVGQLWFSDITVTDVDPTGLSQTQFLPYL